MSKLRSDELVNMEGDGAPSFPQGATSIEPTTDNQVATKSYVDLALSAASGNLVSDTAPTNPALGSFWTDTSVSPSLLKTWNGSMWIEFAGEGTPYTGFLGSPVEVLTPLDGAGVGGAFDYQPVSEPISAELDRELAYGTFKISTQFSGYSNVEYSGIASNGNGTIVMTGEYSSNGAPFGIAYQTGYGYSRGVTATGGRNFKDVIWTGSNFIVVAEDSPWVYHSPDGINWSPASDAKSGNWDKISRNDQTGRLLVSLRQTSPTNRYMYSDDEGDTWTYSSGVVNGYIGEYMVYGNGLFVTLPNRTSHGEWSTDGVNWTQANIDSLSNYRNWRGFDYSPTLGIFLAVGSSNDNDRIVWARSADGKSFTTYETNDPYNASYSARRLKWVHDRFIMVQYMHYDYLLESVDGTTWNNGPLLPTHSNNSQRSPSNYCWTGRNFFVHSESSGEYFYYSSGASLNFSGYDTKYYYGNYELSGTNVFRTSDDSLVPDAQFEDAMGTYVRELGGTNNVSINILSPTTFRTFNQSTSTAFQFNVGDRLQRYNTITQYGPSPSEIVFTSQNANTTPVSATDATVAFRKWTLETRASSSDPWTVVTTSDDYDIVASQDGSTPWSASPTLQPNTSYRVKVSYHSANAEEVESVYNTFETGPAS